MIDDHMKKYDLKIHQESINIDFKFNHFHLVLFIYFSFFLFMLFYNSNIIPEYCEIMNDRFLSNLNPVKLKTLVAKLQAAERVQCNICCQTDGKYKCPKCKIRYCSVKCFKSPKHKHSVNDSDIQISKGIRKQDNKKDIKGLSHIVKGLSNFSEASQRIFNGRNNDVKIVEDDYKAGENNKSSTGNSSTIKKIRANEERQQNVSKMLNMLTLPQLQIQLLILNAIVNEKKTSSANAFQNFADLSNDDEKSNTNVDSEDSNMNDDKKELDTPVSTTGEEEFNSPLIFAGSADDNPDARQEIALKKLQSLREGGDHHNELFEEFCKLFEQLESK